MSRAGVKLISLNIELDRHLDRIVPFFAREEPDIVCLQEVLLKDLPRLEETLKMQALFEPVCIPDLARNAAGEIVKDDRYADTREGIALLSRLPLTASGAAYYHGTAGVVPRRTVDYNRMLLWGRFDAGKAAYTIGTTHFTWTPDGRADEAQRRDAAKLLEILARFPDIALCGDFNTPRGREVWELFAARYTDSIPAAYESSLDPTLHIAGYLKRMVDGLFTTEHYRASDVRLVEGVSDHKAVVGMIERV